jgi:uncharacterized protein DUF5678
MTSSGLEVCPKCKHGLLRPSGNVGDPENQSSDTRESICDACGHRKVSVIINDRVIINDSVTTWIAKHSNELEKYEGQYVAIQENEDFTRDIRVIASGSYDEVMTVVENKFPGSEPVIMKIPTRDPSI